MPWLIAAVLAFLLAIPTGANAQPSGDDGADPVVTIAPGTSTFGTNSVTVTVTWSDNGTLDQSTAEVRLNGVLQPQFVYSSTGAGSGTSTGTVALTSGSNGLAATICDLSPRCKTTVVGYTYTPPAKAPIVDTSPYNSDLQRPDLCLAACFATVQTLSTVPYFSLGAPRSVTLVYHGDQLAARPLVTVDVKSAATMTATTKYQLQVRDSAGVAMSFTTGETVLDFRPVLNATSRYNRLAGVLDATTYATGSYRITIVVTAVDGTGSYPLSIPARLLVRNERRSPIAKGWTVAGVGRLVATPTTATVTDGDGGATVYAECGSGCWSSPAGDFSVLTTSGSGTGLVYKRRFPDRSVLEYNNTGQLVRAISLTLDTTSFVYDGSGRLTRINDPYRKTTGGVRLYTQLTYGTHGLATIQEPGPGQTQAGGRTTTLSVVSDSTLQQWTDPGGGNTRLRYETGTKRLELVINRRGDTTQFVSDSTTWRLAQIQAPRITVDTGNGSTAARRPTTTYTPYQTVAVPRKPMSQQIGDSIRVDRVVGTITDPRGDTTKFTLNPWGQPLTVTDALGQTTTYTRSTTLVTRVLYPTGAVDSASYSGGRLTRQRLAGQQPTTIEYDAYDLPSRIAGPNQRTRQIVRTSQWQVTQVKDSAAGSWASTGFTYNALRRPSAVTDPGGHVTTYRYHGVYGHVDSTQAGGGSRWSLTLFDAYGRDSVTKAPGATRVVRYDALNRVRGDSVVGQSRATTFAYDSLYLVQVVDPKLQIFRHAVNALGWVTARQDPADTTRVETMLYNVDGLVTRRTNRRSQWLAYTYDALHRQTQKSGSTGVTVDNFGYNATGTQMVAWNAHARDSIFTNGATGWTDSVVTRVSSQRFRRHFGPTVHQELASVRDTSGAGIVFPGRSYHWNPVTRALDSLRVNNAAVVRWSYNPDGQEVGRWYPGASGLTRSTEYTTTHAGYSVSYSRDGGVTSTPWLTRSYALDSLNRHKEMTMEIPGAGGVWRVRPFRYDALGRLSGVDEVDRTVEATCTSSSELDSGCAGSQQSGATLMSTSSFAYDAAGNLARYQLDAPVDTGRYGAGNRILQFGAATYDSLDRDGNVRARTMAGVTTHFTWNADGQLTQLARGSTTFTYAYDALGRLVKRSRNGVADRTFLWTGDELWAELDGTATARRAEYVYEPGTLDRPLALVTGATTVTKVRELHQDQLGNVVGVTDGTGLALLDYQAYGALRGSNWVGSFGDTLRLRWKGMLYEDADTTQLYYVRNRWYDVQGRRFLSEDPIGIEGGLNQYTFAGGDPINHSDPTGLDCTAAEATKITYTRNEDGDWVETRTCPAGMGMGGVTILGGGLPFSLWSGANPSEHRRDFGYRGSVRSALGASDSEAVFRLTGKLLRPVVGGLNSGTEVMLLAGSFLPVGRAGVSTARAMNLVFKSAHGARHLAGTGLGAAAVEAAIAANIGSQVLGSHWGWVQVGSQWLQYRAYQYTPGILNIGTYFPVAGPFSR